MSLTPEQTERYARHILLKEVGGQGQQKLLTARVLVVGAGGLGAPLIQYLSAAGVGHLGIADDDTVALSNLQRQVIFATNDIGKDKVSAAAAAASSLNPGANIIEHPFAINRENVSSVLKGYDLVVEGVDNFTTRYILNDACIAARIPLVSAAVGRYDGQLSVYKPYEQPGRLPCYRCFVPEEPPRDAQVNCAEEGVLGAVTGVMGTLAAMEVLKELLGIGRSLAGRILIYDGLAAETRTIELTADPTCRSCSKSA